MIGTRVLEKVAKQVDIKHKRLIFSMLICVPFFYLIRFVWSSAGHMHIH